MKQYAKPFFLSLILHLCLATIFFWNNNSQHIKSHGVPIIKAYLFHTKTNTESRALQRKKVIKKIIKKQHDLLKKLKVSSAHASYKKTILHEFTAPKPLSQGERSRILEALHDAINKDLVYPEQAQFLNTTGTVRLKFTLEPSGSIDKISILKSSGSSILDHAALTALKAISPFYLHVKIKRVLSININFDA